MSEPVANDGDAIRARIEELRREREERAHSFGSNGACTACGKAKDSFAATMPCAGGT